MAIRNKNAFSQRRPVSEAAKTLIASVLAMLIFSTVFYNPGSLLRELATIENATMEVADFTSDEGEGASEPSDNDSDAGSNNLTEEEETKEKPASFYAGMLILEQILAHVHGNSDTGCGFRISSPPPEQV